MDLQKILMTFIKPGILVLTLLMASNFSWAQKPEAEIERFVRDFAHAYENLPKNRDEESVLKYVSKELNSTILKSNVMDNFGLIQSDYNDFKYHLKQLVETDGMSVTYKIKNIYKSKVQGQTGVVVCEIEAEVASRGVIWNKSTEMTTFALKKYNNGWKILHFFVVGLEDQQLKGICMLELFESSTGDFVVKTIVPKGNSYDSRLNTFDFNQRKNQSFIKVNNENSYTWGEDGTINKLNDENSSVKKIGTANDKNAAAMLIITKDLYKDNCTEFKVKH